VQGIAWDEQGRLWETEFGSDTWDEINLIQPGENYGWPAAEGTGHLDGMTDPYAVFSTSAASPSGLAYAGGALWLGALQGQTTWRVPVTASGLGTPRAVRLARARTRTVVLAPDGSLWVTTSNTDGRALPRPGDDRILAIRPS
jgi:glucose/arabinose dehydrogenase